MFLKKGIFIFIFFFSTIGLCVETENTTSAISSASSEVPVVAPSVQAASTLTSSVPLSTPVSAESVTTSGTRKALLLAKPSRPFRGPPEPPPEKTFEQTFIESNISISEWFDTMAEGLDLFLAGKKVTNRRNDSRVKIENGSYSREGDAVVNTTSLSINPRFPNLEEYMQLKFTNYDEQAGGRGVRNNYLRQGPRERNYGASVGVFRKLGNVRTSFQPRIELQDPLKVSHSLAFESVADLKTYEINPKMEFFANPTVGTGTFQVINFNFNLSPVYALTFLNEGEYLEKFHKLTVTNGVSLSQVVTKRSALTYSLVFSSLNRESYHLEGYSFAVSWNQMIYKNILDYQLTPHLDFDKENKFKGRAGLSFILSLLF